MVTNPFLFQAKNYISLPVININGKSLVWLLSPGHHELFIPSNIVKSKENSWCGYGSFSESSIVTTKGLKWDLGTHIK